MLTDVTIQSFCPKILPVDVVPKNSFNKWGMMQVMQRFVHGGTMTAKTLFICNQSQDEYVRPLSLLLLSFLCSTCLRLSQGVVLCDSPERLKRLTATPAQKEVFIPFHKEMFLLFNSDAEI